MLLAEKRHRMTVDAFWSAALRRTRYRSRARRRLDVQRPAHTESAGCLDCWPDRYLRLLYGDLRGQPGDSTTFRVEGVDGGSISMLSVCVGDIKK
jgi:hypothetical protein